MTPRLLKLWLLSSFMFIFFPAKAQISYGGSPVFKEKKQKSELKLVRLPYFENVRVEREYDDIDESSYLKHARYAHRYSTLFNCKKTGVWEQLNDGRRVWRLAISSSGAYSLGLEFSKFKLAEGSQLFVYNHQTSRVLGAYTEKNNKNSGKFSIEPLQGDEIILEYIEPANKDIETEIEISSILHDYKDVFNKLKGARSSLKSSGGCNVNINCIEGNDWQKEKKSVCFILYGGMIASGAMINNTSFDGRPYLLTANHVLDSQEDADFAIFHFGYEHSECNSSDASRSQSISGANIVATTYRLDFSLVELSVMPPAAYNSYYAGWDRSGRVPLTSVCIHHPNGDAKKISIDDESPVTDSYSDSKVDYDDNTHWKILEWDVGTTEGGSSGSPLFDENHRIIGDLTGGEANCEESVDDYFAKFSESWANYSEENAQLKVWLDPLNLGVYTLDGMDPYKGVRAAIKSSKDSICFESDLTFTDVSEGEPSEFFWNFGEGAVPQFSTEQGPHTVSYLSPGGKKIKLIVKKDGVSDSVFYNVLVMKLPVPAFSYTVDLNKVQMINSSEQGQSYLWDFGDGSSSVEDNPEHLYSDAGKYMVTLTARNLCGRRVLRQEIKTIYEDLLKIYPNPSNGIFVVDLSQIIYSRTVWSVYDSKGEQIRTGVISNYDNMIQFNLNGMPSGVYLLKLNIDGEILKRRLLLVG